MTCFAQKDFTDQDLLSKHAQNFEDKERKKHISNLIRFFIFLISTFWSSHTIPIILYSNKYFFVKNSSFFYFIFNTVYISLTTPFYSGHVIYFVTFHSTLKNIFLKKTNKTLIFNFSFFIQNKISSYFEKKKE